MAPAPVHFLFLSSLQPRRPLHSSLLQVGLSSIGMFLGNSDTHQLLTAIGSGGSNSCITFSDISSFVAEEAELTAGGSAADVTRPEVTYPKLTAKLLASLTAQQFGSVKKVLLVMHRATCHLPAATVLELCSPSSQQAASLIQCASSTCSPSLISTATGE